MSKRKKDRFEEGPQREIYEWKKVLKFANKKPLSFFELQEIIRITSSLDNPPGWLEQPLFSNKIIRRILRTAIMHWNLSPNKHNPYSKIKIVTGKKKFISSKFPGNTNIHLYEAKLAGNKIFFIGNIDVSDSVYCLALYLQAKNNTLRPLKNLDELLNIIGVKKHSDSEWIFCKKVISYLDFSRFIKEELPINLSRWFQRNHVKRPESLKQLFERILKKTSFRDAIFKINCFLESTMITPHLNQYAYINDLEKTYRSSSLYPVTVQMLKIPQNKAKYYFSGNVRKFLKNTDSVRLFIHPTTIEVVKKVDSELLDYEKEEFEFYPTIGARSGYLKKNGEWLNWQLKIDLFRILSGWYRLCGYNAIKEETEAANFFIKYKKKIKIPDSLILMPNHEGVLYNIKDFLSLASLVRYIPETCQSEILVPAAYLYSHGLFSYPTFLHELTEGMKTAEIDEFFANTIIDPITKAINYFLSLDVEGGDWGLAFEMHGANFYYLYDVKTNTLKNKILTKDFASNRILNNKEENLEKSQEWLINEYDQSLGFLFLTPLVETIATISGKPKENYDRIIVNSFKKNISSKNKKKFLVNGKVVGSHEDVYDQLEYFFAPRKKTWIKKPRFRPSSTKDYLN